MLFSSINLVINNVSFFIAIYGTFLWEASQPICVMSTILSSKALCDRFKNILLSLFRVTLSQQLYSVFSSFQFSFKHRSQFRQALSVLCFKIYRCLGLNRAICYLILFWQTPSCFKAIDFSLSFNIIISLKIILKLKYFLWLLFKLLNIIYNCSFCRRLKNRTGTNMWVLFFFHFFLSKIFSSYLFFCTKPH